MLVTFDEKMRPMPVPVRVGAAVDVVGQAGKPKTITGKKKYFIYYLFINFQYLLRKCTM